MKRPDHLSWIRTLPCCLCLNNIKTEAAHIKMADARIGKQIASQSGKEDDKFVLPLCGQHHRDQHATGERKFWEKQGIDPVLLALALYSADDAEEAERIIRAAQRAR